MALSAVELPPAGVDYLVWKRALLARRAAKSAKDMVIANAFVQLGVGFAGAWGFGTTGGDPASASDDDLDLSFSLTGDSNGLALKVDGVLHVLDESSPTVTQAADGTSVDASWTLDGVLLQAHYELVDNGSGRADTAKVTYTVTNPAAKGPGATRSVGLKLGLDVEVGNAYGRLVTPAGAVAVESGFGQTGSGGAYALAVPDFWQGYEHDTLAAPGLIGQGTLVGGGATAPDKVVIGAWSTVVPGSRFDYAPSGASFGDGAVALWWFDRSLPVGGAASFVVLYGMGQMSQGGTELVAAVSAPTFLTVVDSAFVPTPFSVMVQVQNGGSQGLTDVPVTVSLPQGLALAAGGSATQSIPALAAGAGAVLNFRLVAALSAAGQTLGYSVRVGSGPSLVVLARSLQLPAIPPVTIAFLAGAHGSLSGEALQTVPVGGATTEVWATADPDYHFERWTLAPAGASYSLDNPLTLNHVQAALTLTAEFVPDAHTVRFAAGPGGRIVGSTEQTVPDNGSTTAVTAEAAYGYTFAAWSDDSTENPRTLFSVIQDEDLTAEFREAGPAAPGGRFVTLTDALAVAAGRGLWDLSGPYSLTVAGHPLVLALVHDTQGRLTGAATYTVGKATVANLPIRGNARGNGRDLVAAITLGGPSRTRAVAANLALHLTLDSQSRQLLGTITGSVTEDGTKTAVSQLVFLPIPALMDGTWDLLLTLVQRGTRITGTSLLTLSNGCHYEQVIRGTASGPSTALLSLTGARSDPPARGITIRATVATLEGHWATLPAFFGKGYGQTLNW